MPLLEGSQQSFRFGMRRLPRFYVSPSPRIVYGRPAQNTYEIRWSDEVLVLYVVLEAVFTWLFANRRDGRISWAPRGFRGVPVRGCCATVVKQAG